METHYCFIDGGALHGRLKNVCDKFFDGARPEFDFNTIGATFTKVFYYDALPVREHGETEAEYELRIAPSRSIFDAAASADRVHVYEGDARRRRRRGLEQKKVDVMLTVDMLTHSFRRNMQRATLLTGDNDFKPLIDALVQDGMFVALMYPLGETSKELMQAADARIPLTLSWIKSWLTVESRQLFNIPEAQNHNPAAAVEGELLSSWEVGRKLHCFYRSRDEFLLTREHDQLNELRVRHKNLELLKVFCEEQEIDLSGAFEQ